jgi:predicted HicB family RNase H-like nuclease/predicted DNA-binding protein
MSTLLSYKTYTAKVEFDPDAQIFQGRVLDINAPVTFEVENAKEVKQEFEKSVDRYLNLCKQLGKTPDRPFKGNIAFRTSPETHRQICLASAQADLSINSWMDRALAEAARRELGSLHSHSLHSHSHSLHSHSLPSTLAPNDAGHNANTVSLVEWLNHKTDAVSTLIAAIKPFCERRGPETTLQIQEALETYIEGRDTYLAATDALEQLLKKGEEDSLTDLLIQIETTLKALAVPEVLTANLNPKKLIGTVVQGLKASTI